MKRLRRYILLPLYLLVLLVLAALWLRGYFASDFFSIDYTYTVGTPADEHAYEEHTATLSFASRTGQLVFKYEDDFDDGSWPADEPPPPPFTVGHRFHWVRGRPHHVQLFGHPAWHDRLSFSWSHEIYYVVHSSGESRILILPTWFVFLLFFCPSVVLIRRTLRHRRRMRGFEILPGPPPPAL